MLPPLLPRSAVAGLAAALGTGIKDVAPLLHISAKTLSRKKKEEPLGLLESSLIAELTLVAQKGVEIFGSDGKFQAWLREPNGALGGQSPMDVLITPTGIRLVFNTLIRLQEGVYW